MSTNKVVPIRLTIAERRELVALGVKAGKSNRSIARELKVDEKMIRLDRRALAKPPEERPIKIVRPTLVKKEPVPSPEKLHERRIQALVQVAQRWIADERLQVIDVEYAVDQAGLRLYQGRNFVERLPQSGKSPDELLALTRPAEPVEAYMPAQLEFWTNWLARWLACCAPRYEDLQDEVLRQISIWARS